MGRGGRGVPRGRRQPAPPPGPVPVHRRAGGEPARRCRRGAAPQAHRAGRDRGGVHRRRDLGRGRGLRGAEHGRAVAGAAARRGREQRDRPVHPDRRAARRHHRRPGRRRSASPPASHARSTSPRSAPPLAPLVERVRERRRPCVVRVHTVRLGPHSKGDDTRPADEIAGCAAATGPPATPTPYPERFAAADARAARSGSRRSRPRSLARPPRAERGVTRAERVAENLNRALHALFAPTSGPSCWARTSPTRTAGRSR